MAQTTPKEAFCQPHEHKSFFFFLLLHTRRSCSSSIVREKDQTHCCIIIQTLLPVSNNTCKRKPSLRENSPTCLPATTSLRPAPGASGTACCCWLAMRRVGPVTWLLACPLLRLLMHSWVILGTAGKQQHALSGRWVSFQCPQDTSCTDCQPAICFLPRLREVFCQDTHLFHRLASQHFKWALLPAGTLRATQVLQKKTGVRCWGGA